MDQQAHPTRDDVARDRHPVRPDHRRRQARVGGGAQRRPAVPRASTIPRTTTPARTPSRWIPAEAAALAQLLIPAPLDPVRGEIEIDLVTEHIPITAKSPYSGRTLGDTQARSRTGASIVAVLRRTGATPSPTPDFRFAIGDTLVVVGTREGVDAVADLIAGG